MKRAVRGFTLIELMIAITLGLLVIAGIGQVFVSSRRGYSAQQGLSQVQQSARFSLAMLERAINSAGDMGFSNTSALIKDLPTGSNANGVTVMLNLAAAPGNSAALLHMQSPIEVYEYVGTSPGSAYVLSRPVSTDGAVGSWQPALPNAIMAEAGGIVRGSDVIVTRYMAPLNLPARTQNAGELCGPGGTIRAASGLGMAAVTFPNSSDPNYLERVKSFPSRVFGMASADRLFVFQASVLPAADGNLQLQYDPAVGIPGNIDCNTVQNFSPSPQSRMGELFVDVYYVGVDAQGVPGLYRMFFDGSAGNAFSNELLVENVESFQVLSAVAMPAGAASIAATPTRYLTGADLRNNSIIPDVAGLSADENIWAKQRRIMAVRVGLLTFSDDQLGEVNDANYQVLETTFSGPEDRRLRQVYEQTFAVRNRARSVVPARGILY
jgi:type IV pilus assembly protein PilW